MYSIAMYSLPLLEVLDTFNKFPTAKILVFVSSASPVGEANTSW